MVTRAVSSYRRGGAVFKAQPTVLVVCEDSTGGKVYLEDAAQHFRAHVSIKVTHCGHTDPKGIVQAALKQSRNFEKIFCVIDRDTHPSFDEAIALARTSNKIVMIVSNPCSEFWYFLHYSRQRRSYTRIGNRSPGEQQVAALREHLPLYGKGIKGLFKELINRLPEARRNAEIILAAAELDGNMNPSTRIHELLKFMEELATPVTL